MNYSTKIKTAAASVLLSLSCASCSDWLSVKMEDKIMEPVLFSNYPGYVAALNGVYMSLNDYYGASNNGLNNILDVMAQYYDVRNDNTHTYRNYMSFAYSDIEFENSNASLWNNGYSLIATTNAILDHLQNISDTPLTQDQFDLLRGEALALRGMLHFDILRRHGSIYSLDSDAAAIPFQPDSKREIQPILSHKDVMTKIFTDLNEAASLLKNVDPIITEGTKDMVAEDNGVAQYDMAFRQLRLNYYAVQGLLARAYLWVGDKTNAYRCAKNEVIDKANTPELTVFPWVTKDQVTADKKPDFVFSKEVMFTLYNSKRESFHNSNFGKSLPLSSRLTFYGKTLADSKLSLFFDTPNDYRYLAWEQVEPSQTEIDKAAQEGRDPESSLYLKKFQPFESGYSTGGVNTYQYFLPMIRLSEMYLIAAEATSDPKEALELVNAVRFNREAPDYPEDGNFNECLTAEFAREMIGEGQLFFFYKRRAVEEVMGGNDSYTKVMELGNYVWPIPEAEINKRTQVNK